MVEGTMFADVAYQLGRLLGLLILVAIGFAIYRDVVKKRAEKDDAPKG